MIEKDIHELQQDIRRLQRIFTGLPKYIQAKVELDMLDHERYFHDAAVSEALINELTMIIEEYEEKL